MAARNVGQIFCLSMFVAVCAPLAEVTGQDYSSVQGLRRSDQTPQLRPPTNLPQRSRPAMATRSRRPSPTRAYPGQSAVYDEGRAIGTGVASQHLQASYQPEDDIEGFVVPATRSVEAAQLGEVLVEQTPPDVYYEETLPPSGAVVGSPRRYTRRAMPGHDPMYYPGWGPPPLIGLPTIGHLEAFAGVHGFTGIPNRGSTSSFGFQEGLLACVPLLPGLNGEIGTMVTQSNFNGSAITDESRHQFFLTAGLSRQTDWGLQGGLAFDWLHDSWDYEVDLGQLRGELSWNLTCRDDIGAWFTVGVSDDSAPVNTVVTTPSGSFVDRENAEWEVDDLFAFFWRRQFDCGGEGRLFGGFTSHGNGLFGGDVRLPMNCRWALEADFIYISASGDDNMAVPAYTEETWNMAFNVVWTPFASDRCGTGYCRPLLGVANNGSFVTRMR